jgi:hypothetical protein
MAASVRLQPFIVPFRALQDMRTQSGRVALTDGLGRALLTAMQRSSGCIRRVVLDENVLERGAHGVDHDGLVEALWSLCHEVAMSNVRAKRVTTAGRQARPLENVHRTLRPGLVACRWRSA